MPNAKKTRLLERLRQKNSSCRRCKACRTRQNYVFGTGDPDARLVFIGEAPGLNEDRAGKPFVGRAGRLLDELLEKAGIARTEVYITNVVKCHPMKDPSQPDRRGNDRPPTREEIAACLPALEEELSVIGPGIVCTLGNTATRALTGTAEGVTSLHGKAMDWHGIRLVPTFHPAAVFHNPPLKDLLAADLKHIASLLSGRRARQGKKSTQRRNGQ